MNLKIIFGTIGAVWVVALFLSAETINDIQTLDGAQRNRIADLISGATNGANVPATRTISTTSPITGGGDLSANRTITFDGSGVFAAGGATNLNASSIASGTLSLLRFDGSGVFNASGGTNLNATSIASGNLSVNRLASGTGASATTFFRGDNTWSVPTAGTGNVLTNGINIYNGTSSTNIYIQGSLIMVHTNIASPAGGAFIHFQSNPTMPDFLHADVTPSGAFTLARGYSSSILIGTVGFGNVGPILSHRNGGSLQLQDDGPNTQIKISTDTVTMGFDSTATEVNNYGTISHPNNPTISGAINFTGNVGYSTNGVAGKLILRKNGATFWAFNLLDGTDFVTNSNLTGVRVQAQNMNSAGARIGGGVLFMSGDPSFTTQTPKLLAAITHRATEGYASDTTGGSAIDFYVSSNGVGAVANPYVAGYWDQDGDLVCSNDFRVAGVTTLGSNGTSISSSQAGAITFDAPSIATLAQFNTNLTVTGAKAGSTIVRGSDLITAGIVILADCTNNGNIVIQLFNNTALSVDPANQTVRVRAINP